MPGNTTQGTGARFSASFTRASRAIRIFARSRRPKRLPPPALSPPPQGFSPLPGSTQTLTCGSATPKTSPPGNCCGMRARLTLTPSKHESREGPTPPPKRRLRRPANRCWPPRAATGAGGSAPNTAPRMTRSLMRCIASTSPPSTCHSVKWRQRSWPSPSSAGRSTPCSWRQRAI